MNKKICIVGLLLLVVLLSFSLFGCDEDEFSINVVFEANGGSDINVIKYTGGEFKLPEKPTKEGYDFDGWYLDKNFFKEFDGKIGRLEDIVLYAKWNKAVLNITIHNGDQIFNKKLNYNEKLDIEIEQKENYEFVGFYEDKNFMKVFDINNKIKSDKDIYMKWCKKVYDINFITNCDEIDDFVLRASYDETLDFQNLERTGYFLRGWYFDNDTFETEFCPDFKITKNINVYAKWEKKYIYVNFDTNGGNFIESLKFSHGDILELPENPVLEGYDFVGWYLNQNLSNPLTENYVLTKNIILYADWNEHYSKGLSYKFSNNKYQVLDVGSCKDENIIIPAYYDDNVNGLKRVNGIESIAFSGVTAESIKIPNTIDYIKYSAFNNCNVKEFIMVEGNYAYTSKDGVLYSNKTLFRYPKANLRTSFTIPDGVEKIGYMAFESCKNLNTIIFSKDVIEIENIAFRFCSATTITLKKGLEKIGVSAFYNCYNLQSISLPSTLKTIGIQAFYQCALKSIDIVDGVETVGDSAFRECSQLKSVYIRQSVVNMGKEVFYNNHIDLIIELFYCDQTLWNANWNFGNYPVCV